MGSRLASGSFPNYANGNRFTQDGATGVCLNDYQGNRLTSESVGAIKSTYTYDAAGNTMSDWYINDHLGTPQKIVDDAGTVVWAAEYEAFGKATVASGSIITNNLRFPGQYYDAETGLHYNWHRYYDPSLGRYLSQDPIGIDGGDLNLYAYVWNNSVNWIDPLGLVRKKKTN